MASKIGTLIKQARTGAGLTQEQLARKITGLSTADISKAERGDLALTQAQLKQIAKITGVTQASLLEAAKASKTTAAKTTSAKTGTAGKTTSAKSGTSAKTTTPKTPANANSTMKVTSTERKLVEYYRAATSDQKKAATKVLKGECDSQLSSLINTTGSVFGDVAQDLIGNFVGSLLGGKREMPEDEEN